MTRSTSRRRISAFPLFAHVQPSHEQSLPRLALKSSLYTSLIRLSTIWLAFGVYPLVCLRTE